MIAAVAGCPDRACRTCSDLRTSPRSGHPIRSPIGADCTPEHLGNKVRIDFEGVFAELVQIECQEWRGVYHMQASRIFIVGSGVVGLATG
ncbi:hypothetical protein, partial [Pseudonocardia alaniniphila]